jgi:acyl carrier protein
MRNEQMDLSRDDVVGWCQEYVGNILGVPGASVNPDATFDRLGIDSALAVSLLIDVEGRYGVEVPPEALFENPTLGAVATYVHSKAGGS